MTTLSARHDEVVATSEARPTVCALLIEARPGTASTLRSLLNASNAADITVLRTATVAAGVDALTFGGIDVAILGSGVATAVSELEPLFGAGRATVPVIALTDDDDPQVADDLIARGVHDCVSMATVTADGLGRTVRRALQRTHARPVAADGLVARPATEVLSPQTMELVTPAVGALVALLELLTTTWQVLDEEQKLSLLSTVRSCAASVEQLTASAPVGRPDRAEPQLVALATAVREAAQSESDLEIVLEIDPHTAVWVDLAHLRQIVRGLLSCATQSGSSPVTVAASTRGTSVRITFTGASAASHLGQRGWSVLHPMLSTGDQEEADALEVVRRLAELNGGIAGVDAQQGLFWVRIPSLPPHPDFS